MSSVQLLSRETWRQFSVFTMVGAAALAITVLVMVWLQPSSETLSSALQPAEVDRLRMRAATGRDFEALALLQRAAQGGHVDAQRAAASVMVADKDPRTAAQGMDLARRAAQRGDGGAQYLLGKTLFEGNAAQAPRQAEAAAWLEKSARQQNSQAAYLLGLIYKSGYGLAKDVHAAAQWFLRSAELGNPDAMFMLATAYRAGEGMARDQRKALELLQAAAALEHPLASQELALAFRDGTLGLARDSYQSEQMLMEVEHGLRHPRSVF